MKIQNFKTSLQAAAVFSAFLFAAGTVAAQNSSDTTVTAAQTVSSAPQLPYGVPQIVQLSQAKISDATIIAYIQNSGNSYGLNATQIIYLRQQGVSDTVINAMLTQPRPVASAPTQTAQQNYSADTSTAVAQPTVTYQTIPSSTVYVIPDTQTYLYDTYYYHPYPYYTGYYYPYYYPYPAVSFSFGFGGYRGGWHHGGGGGGGWHHH